MKDIKIGYNALCIKDRIDINGRIVHKKGKKYLISDILIKHGKLVIQLVSESYDAQYLYAKNDNSSSYSFKVHFVNEKYLRLKKLQKLQKVENN